MEQHYSGCCGYCGAVAMEALGCGERLGCRKAIVPCQIELSFDVPWGLNFFPFDTFKIKIPC